MTNAVGSSEDDVIAIIPVGHSVKLLEAITLETTGGRDFNYSNLVNNILIDSVAIKLIN